MDITTAVIITGVISLGAGVAIGAWINYILETKPLQTRYDNLLDKLIHMKKQGFVPQYAVEQRKTHDVSEDVREY